MEPGAESALLDLLDAPKRNKALQFVLANASLVVGWKQAGLSHADIAVLLARLGFPVTAKRASALYVRAKALADPEQSRQIARGIDAARLARALPAAMAGSAEEPPPEVVKPWRAGEASPAPSAPVYRSPEPSLEAPKAEEPAPAAMEEPEAGRFESFHAFVAGLFSRP